MECFFKTPPPVYHIGNDSPKDLYTSLYEKFLKGLIFIAYFYHLWFGVRKYELRSGVNHNLISMGKNTALLWPV